MWDEGTVEIVRQEPDHPRSCGAEAQRSVRTSRLGERRWILVKASDDDARPGSDLVAELPASVRGARTWEELAADPVDAG
jgi:hypothetical protein